MNMLDSQFLSKPFAHLISNIFSDLIGGKILNKLDKSRHLIIDQSLRAKLNNLLFACLNLIRFQFDPSAQFLLINIHRNSENNRFDYIRMIEQNRLDY